MEKDFVGAGKDMDGVMKSQNGGVLVGAFTHSMEDKPLKPNGDEPQKANGAEVLSVEDSLHPSAQGPALEYSREVDSAGKVSQLAHQVAEELKEEVTGEKAVEKVPNLETQILEEPAEQITAGQLASAPVPGTDSMARASAPNSTSALSGTIEDVEIIAATEPSVVYLTSDSPHTLDRLSPYTSYIIGGIVDKNRHKGLCYKRACERGIPTAKLPIGEYMTMQSRSVLATNHVVEIMLKWLDTGDWGEAFLSVIPKRKEAKLRIQKEAAEEDGKDEENGEDEESEKDVESEDEGDCGDEDKARRMDIGSPQK